MAHAVEIPSNETDKETLIAELDALDMSLDETKRYLMNLARLARSLARKALDHSDYIFEHTERRQWKDAFNKDRPLLRWFGEVKSSGKAKNVRNRLEALCSRIDKGVTMKLRPNKNESTGASNYGWVFTPRGMKVYPNLFDNELENDERAAVILHELMHVWFDDKKIKGNKVYNAEFALKLAMIHPSQARRSPENYERYCLEVWRNT